MKNPLTTCLGLGLFLALGACVEQSQELTSADREQARQYVLSGTPHPQHPLDVRLEDRVTLVGYDLDPETVAPGGTFTVTWYWKVNRSLGDGWHEFTHLVDGDHAPRLNQDGVGWVREHYDPSHWRAGDVIKDVQPITLPGDWPVGSVTLYIGLWNGPARLRVLSGPHDGDNRIRALTVPVVAAGAAAPPTPAPAPTPTAPALPNLQVSKATSPIVVDGKLDEPAWTAAVRTARFVQTMTGGPADFASTARVTWDDENFYVGFEVADDFLKSTFTHHDDHLWEQDTVELMLDPAGDQRNYFELQVAPTGQSFETRYDTPRQPQPFGDLAWTSHLRAHVDLRGTVNDDRPDQGYTVELAIPWTAFAAGTPPTTKPTAGTTWAMNLFVMDTRPDGSQRAAAWSPPVVGDFHTLGRFGRVTFVDARPVQPVAPPGPPGNGPPPPANAPPGQPANGAGGPHVLTPEQLRGSIFREGVRGPRTRVAPP